MSFSPPIPKEHGSWAMLTTPLLLGLAVAPGWHWRTIILLTAALGFFLVRFPLATLVKTRRNKRTNRAYWWQWAGIYGGITTVSGLWLIVAHSLWWLAPMGVIGGGLVLFHLWLITRRQEMSVIGELAGIAGLALGAPMAYYAAVGQLDWVAGMLWLLNALYFGGTVFYIKLKVRQQPKIPAPNQMVTRLVKAKACLGYQSIVLTIILILTALHWIPPLTPLAFLPVTVKMLIGAGQWQDKKSLSLIRLGVIEIFHTLAFAGLVIIAFR
jgi:hypothetical protein